MEPELVAMVTQFGVAGLVAAMWLSERRAAANRERQLGEAHERLMEQRVQVDALMSLIGENTRAVTAVEAGQRSLSALVARLSAIGAVRIGGGAPMAEDQTGA